MSALASNTKNQTSFGLPYVGTVKDFNSSKEFAEYGFSVAREYTNNKEQTFSLGALDFVFIYEQNDACWYHVYVGEVKCGSTYFYPNQLYKVGILSINNIKYFFNERSPFTYIDGAVPLVVDEPPMNDEAGTEGDILNKPLSRIEQYLSYIATGEGELPYKPLSRIEQYLNYIATGEGELPIAQHSRAENYLNDIAQNGKM